MITKEEWEDPATIIALFLARTIDALRLDSNFLDQLRQNDIDYDVLNVAEARYPRVELPQWNL